MTTERLAELERITEVATPGPWRVLGGTPEAPCIGVGDSGNFLWWSEETKLPAQDRADARFIAEARTAVPELLAEVRRLQALTTAEYVRGYNDGERSHGKQTALDQAVLDAAEAWTDEWDFHEPDWDAYEAIRTAVQARRAASG